MNYKKIIAGLLSLSMITSFSSGIFSSCEFGYKSIYKVEALSMNISESGINFIKAREGFIPNAEYDYKQYSIGYGCHCEKNQYPNGITKEQADTLLRSELKEFVSSINNWASNNNISLTQYQFDALVSFSFNVGTGSFTSSTLAKRIIAGSDQASIKDAFAMWNKVTVNGTKVVSKGLTLRRELEANLYNCSNYDGCEVSEDNISSSLINKLSEIKVCPDTFEIVLQGNYRNVSYPGGDDDKYSVADDGCALIAAMNIIKWNTGKVPDIDDLAKRAIDSGDRKWGQSGTAASFFRHYADQCGTQYDFSHISTVESSNKNTLKNYLNQGYDVILHVTGHYIAVVDYDSSSDKILVIDGAPSSKRCSQDRKAVWIPLNYFNNSAYPKLYFTGMAVWSFGQPAVTTKENLSIFNLGNYKAVTSRYNYSEPKRTLKLTYPMMSGDDVKWLQAALSQAGYSTTIDGIFGNRTESSVKSYQRDNGLAVDGIVGKNTISSLEQKISSSYSQVSETPEDVTKYTEPSSSRILSYKSPIMTGDDVKWVQSNLNYLMGAGLSVDGQYGPKTRTAVVKFQSTHGLDPDGMVGPKTFAEMRACLNNTQGQYIPNESSVQSILSNGYSAPSSQLSNGSKGDSVKWLQLLLNNTINAGLVIDGSFGAKTADAVRAFQKSVGIVIDGIVGSNTLKMLKEFAVNLFVGASAEPTMVSIELLNRNKAYYAENESVDFVFDTDAAEKFDIVITDESGKEVFSDTTEEYRYSAYLNEAGVYQVYVTGYNDSGSCTSSSVTFEIISQSKVEAGSYLLKFDVFDSKLTHNIETGSISAITNTEDLGDIWRIEQNDDWTVLIINAETDKYLVNDNGSLALKTYEEVGGIDIDNVPENAKWFVFEENGYSFIKNKYSNEALTTNMNGTLSLETLDMMSISQAINIEAVDKNEIKTECSYLDNGDVLISWDKLDTADSYQIIVYAEDNVYMDEITEENGIVFKGPNGKFTYTVEAYNNGVVFVGSEFDSEDNAVTISPDNDSESSSLLQDLIKLKKYLLGIEAYTDIELELMDYNLDEKVNIIDFIVLKEWIIK